MPGYAGGHTESPTYEEISSGNTGHAEVSKVEYDPDQISYEDLLTVFFATHDPTQVNRQGNDVGEEYRSIILYTTPEQKKSAEAFIQKLSEEESTGKVVTEVKPLDKFYPAEKEHRQYYERNQNQPYCQVIISPKLKKLKERFSELLKK